MISKAKLRFKKVIQFIIWLIDINIIVAPVFILSLYLQPFENITNQIADFCFIYIDLFGIHQFFAFLLSKNQLDCRKDALLAYIRLLKRLLLYMETNQDFIATSLKKEIDELGKEQYLIDKDIQLGISFINKYLNLKEYAEVQLTRVKLEIIETEHNLEYLDLKWHNTIFLKHLK